MRRLGSARGLRVAAGLAAVCLLALLFRSLGFESVFPGNGEVFFVVGDGHYHARRALFGFVNFPSLLTFDPYLNYPDGAGVPVPPLLDFLVAAAARAFGRSVSVFEHVLAWSTPVHGALTPLPIYFAARAVGSAGVALGAGMVFALLPASVFVSRLGDADHHAAVAGLGATLLALCMASVAPGARGSRLASLGGGLALARLAILGSWSGSLLYLAIADGVLALAGVFARRPDLLAMQGASALLTGVLVLPLVLWLPTPPGGEWSALTLSRLHVWAVLAVAAVAGALAVLEQHRASRGPFESAARLAGVGAVIAASSWLVLPGLREGLLPGASFLGTTERTGLATAELQPLFSLLGRPAHGPATFHYGLFAWVLPLAPVAALAAAWDARTRAAALVLAGWATALGALAVWQVRYGGDFAPAASLCFALLLAQASRFLVRLLRAPGRAAAAVALALGALAFYLPFRALYLPQLRASWSVLSAGRPIGDPALATPTGSLIRFLQSVRRATPETSGFLDAGGFPEYGVLNPARIGHPIHYVARRASAADGLLHTVGAENFAAARRFFEVKSEAAALEIAKRLRARYVVTMFFPGATPESVATRLQRDDGAAGRRLRRFRLVTEGPPGGRPLGDLLQLPRPEAVVPYKLFEVVAGALLEVRGAPGAPVLASVTVQTPTGRRFEYRAMARVEPEGVARLRVPYATEGGTPAHTLGPWRVRVGDAERSVRVGEADVLEGRRVPVAGPAEASPAARGTRATSGT